jgi:hypothetical protein
MKKTFKIIKTKKITKYFQPIEQEELSLTMKNWNRVTQYKPNKYKVNEFELIKNQDGLYEKVTPNGHLLEVGFINHYIKDIEDYYYEETELIERWNKLLEIKKSKVLI